MIREDFTLMALNSRISGVGGAEARWMRQISRFSGSWVLLSTEEGMIFVIKGWGNGRGIKGTYKGTVDHSINTALQYVVLSNI
jgi:hypothetical protein